MIAVSEPRPLSVVAHNIGLTLGEKPVLSGISAEFLSGRWTAIVGPNGAGKSSLLRLLAGITKPQAGSIILGAKSIFALSEQQRARQVSWMSQQPDWAGGLTVRDVVRLGRLPFTGLLGARTVMDESCVEQAMLRTECEHLQHRSMNSLSGGERQRVLLARVLAVMAPVCLLDEPMTHLDPPHQRSLVQWIRHSVAKRATVVTVLHDLNWALLADHVVLLDQGQVKAQGPPDNAALHTALLEVFNHSISIEHLNGHWLAQYRF
jgi:iron complex transport system ATP-binding protein